MSIATQDSPYEGLGFDRFSDPDLPVSPADPDWVEKWDGSWNNVLRGQLPAETYVWTAEECDRIAVQYAHHTFDRRVEGLPGMTDNGLWDIIDEVADRTVVVPWGLVPRLLPSDGVSLIPGIVDGGWLATEEAAHMWLPSHFLRRRSYEDAWAWCTRIDTAMCELGVTRYGQLGPTDPDHLGIGLYYPWLTTTDGRIVHRVNQWLDTRYDDGQRIGFVAPDRLLDTVELPEPQTEGGWEGCEARGRERHAAYIQRLEWFAEQFAEVWGVPDTDTVIEQFAEPMTIGEMFGFPKLEGFPDPLP